MSLARGSAFSEHNAHVDQRPRSVLRLLQIVFEVRRSILGTVHGHFKVAHDGVERRANCTRGQ